MITLIHVLVSTLSLVYAAAVVVLPSRNRIWVMYGLIGTTVASGVWLAVIKPSHMASICISGLFYLAVACTCTFIAQKRLADSE